MKEGSLAPAPPRPVAKAPGRPVEGSHSPKVDGAAPASRVAVAEVAFDPSLAAAAVAEVRAALRGRTAEEMTELLRRDRASIEATLRALVAQGALVARGPRFFMS